jgi:hypothetical protein
VFVQELIRKSSFNHSIKVKGRDGSWRDRRLGAPFLKPALEGGFFLLEPFSLELAEEKKKAEARIECELRAMDLSLLLHGQTNQSDD